MGKSVKIYMFFIVILLTLLVINDSSKPIEITWEKSFDTSDKNPFGLYILDNEVKDLFKKRDVSVSNKSPYELFHNQTKLDNEKNTTLISVSGLNAFGQTSEKSVLNFVSKGNTLFIAAEEINPKLQKELKFEIKDNYLAEARISMELTNKNLYPKKYKFFKGTSDIFISSIDSATTTVLGKMTLENKNKINFIRINYGKGFVYVHTQPIIFTNFYLLHKENYHFAEDVLSYIKTPKIYWINSSNEASTLVRFIVSEPALRWAWYIFLLGILIFLFFNTKRRQRIIPIIQPLPNTTVEFVRTIGNLYYREKDYKDIIEKNCTYILEKLRNDYFINTHVLDDKFVHQVMIKLRIPREDIQALVNLIEKFKKSGERTENDLIQLNKAIDKLIKDGK